MARKKRNPKAVALAQEILKQYDPQSAEEVDDALKEIFGPFFESMLQGEMNHNLGYSSNSKKDKETSNRRNGYSSKTLKSSRGEVDIEVPRNRDASFEPQVIKKRQRDISKTIEDIYGFSVSHELIADITDSILEELEEWQNRPLQKCYAFLFVDGMYVTIRNTYESKEYAVYTLLGYDIQGRKEVLGLWLNESESKHKWMQIFDEIKSKGVSYLSFEIVFAMCQAKIIKCIRVP